MTISAVVTTPGYTEYHVTGTFSQPDAGIILNRADMRNYPSPRLLINLRVAKPDEAALLALVEAIDGPDHGHRPDIALLVDEMPFDARLLGPAPDGRARHVRAFTDRQEALIWLGLRTSE